jgi:hypothetical protein
MVGVHVSLDVQSHTSFPETAPSDVHPVAEEMTPEVA